MWRRAGDGEVYAYMPNEQVVAMMMMMMMMIMMIMMMTMLRMTIITILGGRVL